MAEVEILRYRIGTKQNERLLSKFLNLLTFSPELPLTDVERRTIALRAAVIEWRYYYVREDIEHALQVAKRGRDLALECSEDIDIEIRGKALSNRAVTLKLKDSLVTRTRRRMGTISRRSVSSTSIWCRAPPQHGQVLSATSTRTS